MFRIDFNKLRFLVCDDNPHMRRILRTLLHSFGAREVYESEDGATALEMYSHYVPDIVITDWSMPIFDGLELAQMIRQPDSKGNPFAPIIMLTGHSEKRRGGGAPDAGGAQILPTSRFRPRGFTSAFSTSSPIRARSSGPRPISDRTAGATPATPISAPSAASAARWKSFSNPRCSTRPGPPFDARRSQGNHDGERQTCGSPDRNLRRPSRHHAAQSAAQGVAAGRREGSRRSGGARGKGPRRPVQ